MFKTLFERLRNLSRRTLTVSVESESFEQDIKIRHLRGIKILHLQVNYAGRSREEKVRCLNDLEELYKEPWVPEHLREFVREHVNALRAELYPPGRRLTVVK